ncbi:hypothetical protein NDU88_003166 [Pleurodeles waltl]|uniref:Uncharacterized protein n=1 Tax=Pleurodeles waltl TaxID=8319 RepID=A0AAV7UXN7_PLEWA|nr:hypothetical protein NDU88_003166 [Pleurodeles waltl]
MSTEGVAVEGGSCRIVIRQDGTIITTAENVCNAMEAPGKAYTEEIKLSAPPSEQEDVDPDTETGTLPDAWARFRGSPHSPWHGCPQSTITSIYFAVCLYHLGLGPDADVVIPLETIPAPVSIDDTLPLRIKPLTPAISMWSLPVGAVPLVIWTAPAVHKGDGNRRMQHRLVPEDECIALLACCLLTIRNLCNVTTCKTPDGGEESELWIGKARMRNWGSVINNSLQRLLDRGPLFMADPPHRVPKGGWLAQMGKKGKYI